MSKFERIIISRHPAAIEFIREMIGTGTPILASASIDDVRGKVVYGNIPLHLAAAAKMVVAVEFEGTPPRGAEYSLEDMKAAGARLVRYVVRVPEEG